MTISPARLEFGSIPLQMVDIKVSFINAIPLFISTMSQVFDRLKDQYDQIIDCNIFDQTPGGAIILQNPIVTVPAIGLLRHDRKCMMSLRQDMILVRWLEGTHENETLKMGNYPGFDFLSSELQRVVEVLELSPTEFKATQISYASHICDPKNTEDAEWFLRHSFAKEITSDMSHYQGFERAIKTQDNIDLRIELNQASLHGHGEGMYFVTSAGVWNAQQELKQSMHLVHDKLTNCFPKLVSDAALSQWQFKEIVS